MVKELEGFFNGPKILKYFGYFSLYQSIQDLYQLTWFLIGIFKLK